MYANMEPWSEIRRRVLTGGLNKRQACEQHLLHWKTLAKMLTDEEPPVKSGPASHDRAAAAGDPINPKR